MNKVTYQKNKIYTMFGKDIFKTVETYVEYSDDDLKDDTLPIEITQDYYNKEFKVD